MTIFMYFLQSVISFMYLPRAAVFEH